MKGLLILEDGTKIEGRSFGYESAATGEVVFTTGMVGYPESLTDPSYQGQILIMTYPIVGSYGVPENTYWESDGIKTTGLIVSNYVDTPSHFQSRMTLSSWLKKEKIPALEIKDTRALTKKIRDQGVMLGKIIFDKDIPFSDPHRKNLVQEVSIKSVAEEGKGKKTVLVIDCGVKKNIITQLLKRNIKVITVPWDYNPFQEKIPFDGIVISNGPGDPKAVPATINTVKKALKNKIPTLGICMGNQILALAAGGNTYKLKFGHRGQNQPCVLMDTSRCYLTTQNHGFVVGEIPVGFRQWFTNANDATNEGIIHEKFPFMSVQFHPEATPGPTDTEWIFDHFLEKI
ncbi:carbamoyl-phosphate synthase (glutamine-hydrolyzing) small subunit [Candidatus Roizmanbacteria bacterium CG09_land_8_20_14_0_10_41_9]|uniref:Carbamoyl phosphate synthase small chain n=1 Tax=Candidatus Roizmanbacteria bacterium CG09_land_8_20_14_0_10_41_9 TaxID=1974850 RepID=A0A2H0WSX8_9BACT|nr:MAG: carbamoyl-phosphate synthase (glutamine-hydrolyzing) small subunit [Candidatus Roizmanbacteria bacterium CG09_land_8_20_14_0_10_41_9]